MKKSIIALSMASAVALSSNAFASEVDGLGLALNYGAFSGPTIELSYPVTETVQLRGALSGGMGLSETSTDTDSEYDVNADGGIHRLALDYHPFMNGFFLSAGYAINNFELSANASQTGIVTVGDSDYAADVTIDANFTWDNAPTLSLGWGHSPSEGLGFMFEAGAFFTGNTQASMTGTCSGVCTDPVSGQTFESALVDEEKKLKKDVADYDFLPMLQAGITYRF